MTLADNNQNWIDYEAKKKRDLISYYDISNRLWMFTDGEVK